MDSKQEILNAIRRQTSGRPPVARPSLDVDWTRYDDPSAKFAEMVQAVGGDCIRVPDLQAAARILAEQPQFQAAQRVFCGIDDCVASNVDLQGTADPHDLEDVDYAVLPGQFGVAENGAIWVTADSLRHRVIYFIVQHLVLVVASDQIVHNMHEAYDRLRFTEQQFGVFIAGPSKTADIEQSLVIGAHGPRSLVVFMVDS